MKKRKINVKLCQNQLQHYSAVGCRGSSKLYLLHSHLEFFSLKTWEPSPMNMAKGSIRMFPKWKRRYSGKWSANMLADCGCSLTVGHQLASVRRTRSVEWSCFLVRIPCIENWA